MHMTLRRGKKRQQRDKTPQPVVLVTQTGGVLRWRILIYCPCGVYVKKFLLSYISEKGGGEEVGELFWSTSSKH